MRFCEIFWRENGGGAVGGGKGGYRSFIYIEEIC